MARWTVNRRVLLGGLGAALAAPPAEARRASPAKPIEIRARPITNFARASDTRTFGRLSFRGGLVLTSSAKDFGGLSGLIVDPAGRSLVAVTDEAHWLSADLTYDKTTPTGLINARLGPLRAANGRPITRKRDGDAEAIALLEGTLDLGTVLIAYERNHRIATTPILGRAPQAPTGFLKLPPEARRMSTNKGIEALTVMTGGPHRGAVLAIAEQFPTADGSHVGWLWLDGEPRRFGITDIGGFEPTDCASLPDGALLVLERRFRWSEGVKVRLRLFAPAEIAPGRIASGTILLEADLSYEIDNMEGLAVHRNGRGTTVLTLVSDNNFNWLLQRTILLQFALT
jgi:hypothetical protein